MVLLLSLSSVYICLLCLFICVCVRARACVHACQVAWVKYDLIWFDSGTLSKFLVAPCVRDLPMQTYSLTFEWRYFHRHFWERLRVNWSVMNNCVSVVDEQQVLWHSSSLTRLLWVAGVTDYLWFRFVDLRAFSSLLHRRRRRTLAPESSVSLVAFKFLLQSCSNNYAYYEMTQKCNWLHVPVWQLHD